MGHLGKHRSMLSYISQEEGEKKTPETEGPKVDFRRVWRMSLSKNPPCPSFSPSFDWMNQKSRINTKTNHVYIFLYICIYLFTPLFLTEII